MSRLEVLDKLYEEERKLLEQTVAGDYRKAEECHLKQKAAVLENVTAVRSHYHESFLTQQSHFQIRKDEIINQVRSSRKYFLITK